MSLLLRSRLFVWALVSYLQKQTLSSVVWAEEEKQTLLNLGMIKCCPLYFLALPDSHLFAATGCLLQRILSCRVE